MEISRREFLRLGLAGGVALALPFGASACSDEGSTGTLLPSKAKLPGPFEVPLPVPSVLEPVRTDAGIDYYEMTQRVGKAEILPGLQTEVWGYDGIFPGPTIESRSGRKIVVRQTNDLPVPVSTHLHGGRTPPDSDGYPTDLIVPKKLAHDPLDGHGRFPALQGLHLPDAAAGRDALVPRPPDGLHRPAGLARPGRVPPRHATTRRTRCRCRAATGTSR